MVKDMANKRKGTHYPYHVSVYTVSYPQAYVYYNIMWAVNSNSVCHRPFYINPVTLLAQHMLAQQLKVVLVTVSGTDQMEAYYAPIWIPAANCPQ